MKQDSSIEQRLFRLSMICVGGAGALAIWVLSCWALGQWTTSTLGGDNIPMPPLTAVLLILFSISVILQRLWPSKPAIVQIAFVILTVTLGMSLLAWAQHFGNFELPLDRWLIPTTTAGEEIPLGRMSPITAGSFLAAAMAYLFELPPLSRRWICRQMASVLAVIVTLASLVVLLSYAAYMPLLYGTRTIPMSLLTALSFLLLGFGLMLAGGRDVWPLSTFALDTILSSSTAIRWLTTGPMTTLLVLFLAIGTAGYFYLKQQLSMQSQQAQRQLSSIADLKAGQIANWYRERLEDAHVVLGNPIIQAQAEQLLANPQDVRIRHELSSWAEALQKFNKYYFIALYGADGVPLLKAPSNMNLPNASTEPDFLASLHARDLYLGDFHVNQSPGVAMDRRIHLALWVPIGLGPGIDGTATGSWELNIDANQFLYPLLQSWPVPSRTAETLLVRREGQEVVFLNESRHRKNTALALRFPLDSAHSFPATLPAVGQEGLMEGPDYRGVPVLAAIRSIPGTPWFMIAKVDQDEIFGPLRDRGQTLGAVLFILLFMSTLSVHFLWKQRENQWLQKELAVERERQEMAERILHVNKQANDIIFLMDRDWRILEANNRAIQIYGYALDELRQLNFTDLYAPESRKEFERDIQQVHAPEGAVLEALHKRKDQEVFPVEISVRTLEMGVYKYHQCIIRDITGRKRDEETVRLLNEDMEKEVIERTILLQKSVRAERAAREALKNIREQLIQNEKMVSLGLLVAGVAHEINNPLAFVTNNLAIMKRDLGALIEALNLYREADADLSAGQPALWQRIQEISNRIDLVYTLRNLPELLSRSREGLDRIQELVKDLRDFARKETSSPQELDLNSCIQTTLKIANVQAKEKQVQIHTELAELPPILGYPAKINQVILNLLTNAVVACPPGGQVTVRSRSNHQTVIFEVEDNGSGIDPAIRHKIFEPFYTTKPQGKGTGLGLSISLGIVRDHGGKIGVESVVGHGAIFRVQLPLRGPLKDE